MGANAQTSVPLYVAAEVLTAADMNISAGTGVPVFATTVTRDAAFGGAGEKVLAEGQLAYIEASNIVQYYDGAAWATVGPSTSAVSAMDSNYVYTYQSTSSTSYVGLTTASSVTLTTGTKALVIISAQSNNNTVGANQYMSFAISGATTTAASDNYSWNFRVSTASYGLTQTAVLPVTLTAGSNTFTTQFRVDAGTGQFGVRTITVLAYS